MDNSENTSPEPVKDGPASSPSLEEQFAKALDAMGDKYGDPDAPSISVLLKRAETLPPNVIPGLIKHLRYDDHAAVAARGYLHSIGKPALDALVATMGGDDPALRSYAAYALGDFREVAQEALPALEKSLQGDDREVRVHAAIAIWKLTKRARETAPIVMEGFSSYAELATKSARYLREMGPDASVVVPELVAILSSEKDGWFRGWAAFALRGMGIDAAPAIPALTKALNDTDEYVAEHAREALRELGK